jgi:hypothetical protein
MMNNPDTLRKAARLGKNARRVEAVDAHADAWEDDIIAWCDTTVERDALRQRLEAAERALHRVREDLNWMLNNRKFLNPDVFEYIDAALAAGESEI